MPKPLLFTPVQIRSAALRAESYSFPMHKYCATEGLATGWHLVNAGKYDIGGRGLVTVKSTKVERRGAGTVGDLGLWRDKSIPGLKLVTDFSKSRSAQ
jgi:2,4-dienoyl-CoA reductase-like NADH-dependent reductase (Old Yellow Enzyme family)